MVRQATFDASRLWPLFTLYARSARRYLPQPRTGALRCRAPRRTSQPRESPSRSRAAASTCLPSPVKRPDKIDMVIFRENTEDIYAGIEYAAGTPEAAKVLDFWAKEFPKEFKKIRFGTREAGQAWQKTLEGIGAPKRDTSLQV